MPCRARDARAGGLSPAAAVALGILQGPTELLPVSSSAHIAIVPWLLGARYDLDEDLQQAFEVALHAGTALALALALRAEAWETLGALDGRTLAVLAASSVPPAAVGYVLERPIARRLGSPATIAAGLAAGALALAAADRAPQRRRHTQAGVIDGCWLGVAQACALLPGVSRNGATLAAARARHFRRADASRLSRHAAVPVIAGATGLKAFRLYRRGLASEARGPAVGGAVGAFASTLACRPLIGHVECDRSPLPWAAYRLALAAAIAVRLRAGAQSEK
jgi:undecaprenyl-diphosphatase